ncbi:MAG: membrane protein [Polaribacter sp.]|jgi:membrane protein
MEERMNYWKAFTKDLFLRFQMDKCSSVAAELTVTSLLALVPLTTLVFALLALIPNFEDIALKLQQFVFAYFVPKSGDTIQNHLVEYVNKAKSVSGLGFAMLFITALMMMRTIDRSFNHIWKIKKSQSKVRTFLVYWAVLTLGPIALGASIIITSYINSLPLISEVVSPESFWFKTILPFLMATIAFSVMYFVIPNRKIFISHAIYSGVVSAILFEFAKYAFGIFIKYFSTYEIVFGALASIPLFLIWIYVSWNIVLFGAEFCHGLANGSLKNDISDTLKIPSAKKIRRLNALIKLAEAQNIGESVTLNDISSIKGEAATSTLDSFDQKTEQLGFSYDELIELVEDGVVLESNDSSFCLRVNANNLTYSWIFNHLLNDFPSNEVLTESELNNKSKIDLLKIRLLLEDFLKKPLTTQKEK